MDTPSKNEIEQLISRYTDRAIQDAESAGVMELRITRLTHKAHEENRDGSTTTYLYLKDRARELQPVLDAMKEAAVANAKVHDALKRMNLK